MYNSSTLWYKVYTVQQNNMSTQNPPADYTSTV